MDQAPDDIFRMLHFFVSLVIADFVVLPFLVIGYGRLEGSHVADGEWLRSEE